jgi:hypothetical protein
MVIGGVNAVVAGIATGTFAGQALMGSAVWTSTPAIIFGSLFIAEMLICVLAYKKTFFRSTLANVLACVVCACWILLAASLVVFLLNSDHEMLGTGIVLLAVACTLLAANIILFLLHALMSSAKIREKVMQISEEL